MFLFTIRGVLYFLKAALYGVFFLYSEARCSLRSRAGLKVTPKGGEGAISFTLCGFHLKNSADFIIRCGTCTSTKNSVKLIAPLSPLRFHLKNPFLTPLYA